MAGRNALLDPVTTELGDLDLVEGRKSAGEVLFFLLRAHAPQRHGDRNGGRLCTP
jgi:hypothetical protein